MAKLYPLIYPMIYAYLGFVYHQSGCFIPPKIFIFERPKTKHEIWPPPWEVGRDDDTKSAWIFIPRKDVFSILSVNTTGSFLD